MGAIALVIRLSPIPPYSFQGDREEQSALESYYKAVWQVVREYGGTAYTVEPNAIVILFPGSATSTSAVQHGVRAAFAIMEQLSCLNDQRLHYNILPYRIGIGLHVGDQLISGRDGLYRLAHNVDQATTLSHLNQQTPFPAIFISGNAQSALTNCPGYYVQELGETATTDQAHPLPILAVMPAQIIPSI